MNSLNKEKEIIEMFRQTGSLYFQDKEYTVNFVGKPIAEKGEGKTDIFLSLLSEDEEKIVKISLKQENADFLENKVSVLRAKKIFGENWSDILIESISSLKDQFAKKPVYYPQRDGHVSAGSYTLGWRLDLINKKSGALTSPLILSSFQKEEILGGKNLDPSKRNGIVLGKKIIDSGVAEYIYSFSPTEKLSPQIILENLIKIQDYPFNIFLTYRAVNYRSLEGGKVDGNRALAVYVKDWTTGEKVYDEPLKYGAYAIRDNLIKECFT